MKKTIVLFDLLLVLFASTAFAADSLYNIPPLVYQMTDISARVAGSTLAKSGTGATMTLVTDVNSPLDGGPCFKFHVAAGVNSYATVAPVTPIAAGTVVGVILKMDTINGQGGGGLFLKFYDSGLGNGYGYNFLQYKANYGMVANKWKICWMSREQFVIVTGSPAAWATTEINRPFTWVKLFFQNSNPAADCNYYIGGVVTYTPAKAKVILAMDDGYTSAYTEAYSKLRAHGWRGCVGVCSSLVGTSTHATLEQLQEMHAYGWDMCNHTSDHTQGTTDVSPATYISKIVACRQYQANNGLTRGSQFLILPGNILQLTNTDGLDYVESYFLMGRGRSARTEYGNEIITYTFTNDTYSPIIPSDMMNCSYYSLSATSQTDYTAATQAFIEKVTFHRGVAILYTHRIKTDPAATDITPTYFDALLADLAAKEAAGQLEVITFTDWWNQIHITDTVESKVKNWLSSGFQN